eukprot:scaffold212020_cov30-Tisochrysis_lutea.AAC.1
MVTAAGQEAPGSVQEQRAVEVWSPAGMAGWKAPVKLSPAGQSGSTALEEWSLAEASGLAAMG